MTSKGLLITNFLVLSFAFARVNEHVILGNYLFLIWLVALLVQLSKYERNRAQKKSHDNNWETRHDSENY